MVSVSSFSSHDSSYRALVFKKVAFLFVFHIMSWFNFAKYCFMESSKKHTSWEGKKIFGIFEGFFWKFVFPLLTLFITHISITVLFTSRLMAIVILFHWFILYLQRTPTKMCKHTVSLYKEACAYDNKVLESWHLTSTSFIMLHDAYISHIWQLIYTCLIYTCGHKPT